MFPKYKTPYNASFNQSLDQTTAPASKKFIAGAVIFYAKETLLNTFLLFKKIAKTTLRFNQHFPKRLVCPKPTSAAISLIDLSVSRSKATALESLYSARYLYDVVFSDLLKQRRHSDLLTCALSASSSSKISSQ